MSRFEKYRGSITINVGDEELVIKPTVDDKHKLMKYGRNLDKDDNMKQMFKVLKDIVKKSYPDDPEEDIDAFLMRFEVQLMEELSIVFGWGTKGDFQKVKKQMMS